MVARWFSAGFPKHQRLWVRYVLVDKTRLSIHGSNTLQRRSPWASLHIFLFLRVFLFGSGLVCFAEVEFPWLATLSRLCTSGPPPFFSGGV